jgi:hypothetical protein
MDNPREPEHLPAAAAATTTTTTAGTEKRAGPQATAVPLNFTFAHLAWPTPVFIQAKVTWVVHHDTGFKVLS